MPSYRDYEIKALLERLDYVDDDAQLHDLSMACSPTSSSSRVPTSVGTMPRNTSPDGPSSKRKQHRRAHSFAELPLKPKKQQPTTATTPPPTVVHVVTDGLTEEGKLSANTHYRDSSSRSLSYPTAPKPLTSSSSFRNSPLLAFLSPRKRETVVVPVNDAEENEEEDFENSKENEPEPRGKKSSSHIKHHKNSATKKKTKVGTKE